MASIERELARRGVFIVAGGQSNARLNLKTLYHIDKILRPTTRVIKERQYRKNVRMMQKDSKAAYDKALEHARNDPNYGWKNSPQSNVPWN